MTDIIIWILKHCTCYSFGWFTQTWNENIFNNFNAYITVNLLFIGFHLICNIIYFMYKYGKYKSKIYLPLALSYLVVNTIFLCFVI